MAIRNIEKGEYCILIVHPSDSMIEGDMKDWCITTIKLFKLSTTYKKGVVLKDIFQIIVAMKYSIRNLLKKNLKQNLA